MIENEKTITRQIKNWEIKEKYEKLLDELKKSFKEQIKSKK
jgi:hypothetical protein